MSYMPQNGKDPLPKEDFVQWVEEVFNKFVANDFHGLKEDVSGIKGRQTVLCALAIAILAAVLVNFLTKGS